MIDPYPVGAPRHAAHAQHPCLRGFQDAFEELITLGTALGPSSLSEQLGSDLNRYEALRCPGSPAGRVYALAPADRASEAILGPR